ncbi:hypothetical protein BOTBODRAFT_173382 [Botryobasidium botryosum FD-172 SS1]|uniref:Uncharacterized protein n=1 Tax=Botryobasidium botryosum (strain FD-172 SS1) TaxID=930990 RepID=A0A067MKM2_BOTB1|nr:hypothetical protein BOTBODRAFT_173382 [Botryobasidium botryosum FD-172 SS1]
MEGQDGNPANLDPVTILNTLFQNLNFLTQSAEAHQATQEAINNHLTTNLTAQAQAQAQAANAAPTAATPSNPQPTKMNTPAVFNGKSTQVKDYIREIHSRILIKL